MTAITIDPRALRQVLGNFVTGVTVITTVDADGRPHGLTANSFSSVSLDPPLVLWSQARAAPSHAVFAQAPRFAISILAEDQTEISRRFASPSADKFAGIATRPGLGGVPLIEACVAVIECELDASHAGGDHTVFIGRVVQFQSFARQPLVFGAGRYLQARPLELGTPVLDPGLDPSQAHLLSMRLATQAANDLSLAIDQTTAVAVWGNHGPTIVHWRASTHAVGLLLQTGLVLPVTVSATGLAFAAFLPAEQVAPALRLELDGGAGAPARDAGYEQGVAAARRDGIARVLDSDDFTQLYGGAIHALSAPVFDANGKMVLALTVLGRCDRLDPALGAPVAQALQAAARGLSARLGHAPP